jgi:hypothetical protein
MSKLILASALALAFIASGTSLALQQGADGREPFSLELPDIGIAPITAPEARIQTADVQTLRLRLKKPFADSINYGTIHTYINGESAGTIQDKRSVADGYIINCDLRSKPRFQLRPGKNVIEIEAAARDGRKYYASYVLIAGGSSAIKDPLIANATVETLPIKTGSDTQPPVVHLSEPKNIISLAGRSMPVKVSGTVTDDSGAVDSLAINGDSVALTRATDTRALTVKPQTSAGAFTFTRTITVGENLSAVVVEARDAAGNLTRVGVPVKKREAAISSKFTGRKFALVIGVSNYKYHDRGLNDLAYADADARSIRDFLMKREGGGFAASDIHYLENEGATLEATRGALKSFLPKAGPADLVFIFIAGHGSPDPDNLRNLYFLLHDTKVADMAGTALPMKELQEIITTGVRAQRVVVFVDTCHSAGLSGKNLVRGRALENNLINLYSSKLFSEAGYAVLTSSDVSEESMESDRWGHGIFTLALLDGFGGEADANRDKLITAGELFNYVHNRVRIETGFEQNPQALPGLNADLTLAFVAGK